MIAVTGATGFLGAHLVCKLLQKGLYVKALKRTESSLEEFNYIYGLYFNKLTPNEKLTWVDADVLDVPALEQALEGVDEVYHSAAMVSFHQKDRNQMMQVNVQGTANVVNICLIKGIKKLGYVSSIAALGRAKDGAKVDEKTQWVDSKLNSNYAVSKHKAEMEVWRGAEEGLKVAIVNPGVILGSGKWDKGSCKLFEMVHKGMPFYTHGINGYVDVKDVADALIALMDKNVFGERFVLVSENTEMKRFLHEAADALGAKKASIRVTPLLAELAWIGAGIAALFTGKRASITKETSRASLKQYFYSSEKIKVKINFEFIPLSKTILSACDDLKQYYQTYP